MFARTWGFKSLRPYQGGLSHINLDFGLVGADARVRPPSQKVMTEIYKPLPEVLYRPLPDGLTISKSKIEGIGLFTTKRIAGNTKLGITHIKSPHQPDYQSYKGNHKSPDHKFENDYIRTPLGGFLNHSDTPNCLKTEDEQYAKGFSRYLFLVTNRMIYPGEELTVKYTLYNLK